MYFRLSGFGVIFTSSMQVISKQFFAESFTYDDISFLINQKLYRSLSIVLWPPLKRDKVSIRHYEHCSTYVFALSSTKCTIQISVFIKSIFKMSGSKKSGIGSGQPTSAVTMSCQCRRKHCWSRHRWILSGAASISWLQVCQSLLFYKLMIPLENFLF